MVFLFVLQEAVQGQVRPTPVSQFTNVSPSALASQTPHKRARDSAPSFCIGKTCPSRALLPGWVGEIILSRTEHAISTRRVFIATQTCDFLRDFVFKGEALRRKHVLAQYAPKFFRSRPSRDDFPNKVMSSIELSVPSWALVSCTKFIQWTSRAVGGLLPLKTFLSVSARINLVVSYSRGPRTRSCPFGWWRHWTHETEEVRSRNSLLRTHKTTETKKKRFGWRG